MKTKHFKIPFAVILLALIFSIIACKKEKASQNLEGHYTGYFIRTTGSPNVDPARATVELHFTSEGFSGNSNLRNYPAICNGNYNANNGQIEVLNSCVFTADFDGTFIFDGDYQYELNGSELRIWRDYANGKSDIYTLQKN